MAMMRIGVLCSVFFLLTTALQLHFVAATAPTLVTDDDNLRVKVGRDKDILFERLRRDETTSVWVRVEQEPNQTKNVVKDFLF